MRPDARTWVIAAISGILLTLATMGVWVYQVYSFGKPSPMGVQRAACAQFSAAALKVETGRSTWQAQARQLREAAAQARSVPRKYQVDGKLADEMTAAAEAAGRGADLSAIDQEVRGLCSRLPD